MSHSSRQEKHASAVRLPLRIGRPRWLVLRGYTRAARAGNVGALAAFARTAGALAACALAACSLAGCAQSGRDAYAQQLQGLQDQLERMGEGQARTDAETGERLAALETALRVRMDAMQTQLVTLQGRLLALETARAEAAEVANDQHAQGEVDSRPTRKPHTQRARRKKPVQTEVAAEPNVPQPDEVRALMASVAARLQDAADPKAAKPVSPAHRDQAQQQLVEADRAAAQDLWQRAHELTLEAQAWLDGTGAQPKETPDPWQALGRDAEQLFPGAVRVLREEVRVQLPMRRVASGELPVDRAALDHVARLAKVYGGLAVTLQVRESEPDEARASREREAVRRHLIDKGHLASDRVRDANPGSKHQAAGRTLVLAFVLS